MAREVQRSEPKDLAFLTARPFAHRGLHGAGGFVENSFAAFDRAIDEGFGIELDVRLTADKSAVVFHDADLRRLVGLDRHVHELTVGELGNCHLNGCGEPIRALREAIIHLSGRAPLLIEAKSPGRHGVESLCRAIRRAIEGANAWAAVMSFDPRIVAWFREHSPQTARGLVITDEGESALKRYIKTHYWIRKARPHFLAFDIRSLPSPLAQQFRAASCPVLAWTVRTEAEHATAAAHADQTIFELPQVNAR